VQLPIDNKGIDVAAAPRQRRRGDSAGRFNEASMAPDGNI
jgi:hypothetical protein